MFATEIWLAKNEAREISLKISKSGHNRSGPVYIFREF